MRDSHPWEDNADPSDIELITDYDRFAKWVMDLDPQSFAFNLSIRASNALQKKNISTIRELVNMTEGEFLKLQKHNRKAFFEIQELLKNMGLTFETS